MHTEMMKNATTQENIKPCPTALLSVPAAAAATTQQVAAIHSGMGAWAEAHTKQARQACQHHSLGLHAQSTEC